MEHVADLDALTALYGPVNPNALAKETPRLTPAYRAWIERAPFFALATVGPEGLDCSPRGDPPGAALAVLDDATLAIPDRRGNNRIDSLRNIVRDPRVALLFMTPGAGETLRVNGRARVTTDDALRRRFVMGDRLPVTVIVVAIGSVYFQCARALTRAALWDPASRVAAGELPTAGEMTRSGDPSFDAETYDAALAARQAATLY